MSRELGPVAELFATLGLDISQLDASLRESKAQLKEFARPVEDITSQLTQLGNAFNPRVIDEALKQMMVDAENSQAAIDELYNAAIRLNNVPPPRIETLPARETFPFGPSSDAFGQNRGAGDEIDAAMAAAERKKERLEEQASYAQLVDLRRKQASQLKEIEEQALAERKRLQKEATAAIKTAMEVEEASRAEYTKMVSMYQKEESETAAEARRKFNADFRVALNEEKALEEERLGFKRVARAEGAALDKAYRLEENAQHTQMAEMRKYYQGLEKEGEAQRLQYIREARAEGLALDKAYNAEEKAQREAMAEIRMYYSRLERESGGGNGSGIGGARNVAFMLQGSEGLLGLKGIPFGLNRILSLLPQVSNLVTAAFDAFVVVAFADIIYQVGTKLVEITDDVNGWGEANKKAWKDAATASIEAQENLLKYQDKQREITNLGRTDSAGDIAARDVRLQKIKEEKAGVDALIHAREDLHERSLDAGINPWLVYAQEKLSGAFHDNQKDLDRQKELQEEAIKLNQQKGDIRQKAEDERRSLFSPTKDNVQYLKDQWAITEQLFKDHKQEFSNAATREATYLAEHKAFLDKLRSAEKDHQDKNKRMRDEIHETPYRLPWWMGENPGDALGSGGSGPRRSAPWNFHPVAGNMPSVNKSMGGTSVILHQTIAPVLDFDGVPADTERFMREHGIPSLVKNIQKNVRGAGALINDALQRQRMTF